MPVLRGTFCFYANAIVPKGNTCILSCKILLLRTDLIRFRLNLKGGFELVPAES
jgi:hypothetical protein